MQPLRLNKLIQNPKGQPSTYPFPPNIAAEIPFEMRQRIMRWMLTNYIWPQVIDRMPYEERWDKLLNMARATLTQADLKLDPQGRAARLRKNKVLSGQSMEAGKADIADTVIFDAVDRLANLNHFVSFKDTLPMQWQVPSYMRLRNQNDVYTPTKDLVDAANAWTEFNAGNQNFYRKHRMLAHHHYVYGVSFVISEFTQVIESVKRRGENNQWVNEPHLTDIGITFEPISIRKLWLNIRIPNFNMQYQPCPFWYEEVPRFAIIANPYDPIGRPMGYSNLENLPRAQYLFSTQETDSFQKALQLTNPDVTLTDIGAPEYNVELKWVFCPMIPLGQITQQSNPQQFAYEISKLKEEERQAVLANPDQPIWGFDDGHQEVNKQGAKMLSIPLKRYIMEAFGNSLIAGQVEIIRLQENFYPGGKLPIYGSAHMVDLDSGVYPPAIGDILYCHYLQITKALNQWLDNKDLLNDPPLKIQTSSPSQNKKDINSPGARNLVNSMNDYEEHAIVDGTGTTPAMLQAMRDQAQTSSKSTDAILGKAMGSRTSATEANNVFQTAMSGATTDINLFNYDISGGYADRIWQYSAIFIDPDILAEVTGQFGFAIKPEHFYMHLELNCAVGSTFIDSLTRQQNFRYMLETGRGDPAINSAELWLELLREWKIPNPEEIVNDQGFSEEKGRANDQACRTYLGELVMVAPDQNHQLAIKVKTSYLEDSDSVWNSTPEYAARSPMLVEQIKMHGMYLQLQQLQMQQQQEAQGDNGGQPGYPLAPNPNAGFLPSGRASLPAQQQGGII